jgi:hypothetical protein
VGRKPRSLDQPRRQRAARIPDSMLVAEPIHGRSTFRSTVQSRRLAKLRALPWTLCVGLRKVSTQGLKRVLIGVVNVS